MTLSNIDTLITTRKNLAKAKDLLSEIMDYL